MLTRKNYENLNQSIVDEMDGEGSLSDLQKQYGDVALHRIRNLTSHKLSQLGRGKILHMSPWYADIYLKWFEFQETQDSVVTPVEEDWDPMAELMGVYDKPVNDAQGSKIFPQLNIWVKDLTTEGVEPNPGPTRNNKNKTTKNPRRRQPNKNKKSKNLELTSVQRPYPPVQNVQKISEVADLSFQLGSQVFNNPGGSIIVEPFYTNDGYDILPSILTPAMQFINYKFSLYRYCKVIGVQFVLTFDNLEQTPMDLYFFSSAQNLASLFPTRAAINSQAATRKLLWTDVMSEQYGKKSQVIMDKVVLPWVALGNKQEYYSSNDFSFTQSSNPARITYAAWVISSPFSIIPTGVSVRTSMNFKLLFYDPLDIGSPLFETATTATTPLPTPTIQQLQQNNVEKGRFMRKSNKREDSTEHEEKKGKWKLGKVEKNSKIRII